MQTGGLESAVVVKVSSRLTMLRRLTLLLQLRLLPLFQVLLLGSLL